MKQQSVILASSVMCRLFGWREENQSVCRFLRGTNFVPSIKGVTSLITKESRVMFLNSPYNLLGSMLSYGDTILLPKIFVKRDMVVISDEMHGRVAYDDYSHV